MSRVEELIDLHARLRAAKLAGDRVSLKLEDGEVVKGTITWLDAERMEPHVAIARDGYEGKSVRQVRVDAIEELDVDVHSDAPMREVIGFEERSGILDVSERPTWLARLACGHHVEIATPSVTDVREPVIPGARVRPDVPDRLACPTCGAEARPKSPGADQGSAPADSAGGMVSPANRLSVVLQHAELNLKAAAELLEPMGTEGSVRKRQALIRAEALVATAQGHVEEAAALAGGADA